MKSFNSLVLFGLLFAPVGCSSTNDTTANNNNDAKASQYVLSDAPTGAIPVGDARKQVKSEDEVTLVGLIGGSQSLSSMALRPSRSSMPKSHTVRRTKIARHLGIIAANKMP